MSQLMLQPLLEATWETIYMVFISSFLSILGGLVIGTVLYISRPEGLAPSRLVNWVLGAIVNITRSVPYIIFMIAIIPLTRLLVGTSIGINAAIVPLTLAAIPFYARIAEGAISEVSSGLVEAAQAMGANNWEIICKVYIPEALPMLIKGGTLTIISLVGYSAMAGAVGGGGLGELAIQYGYQRFNVTVMLETVIILVVLVQLVQSAGDWLARIRKLTSLVLLSIVLWIYAIAFMVLQAMPQPNIIKVGIVGGPMQAVMQVAKKVAAEEGIKLKVVVFDDYILPNTALNNGNIDANIFQHLPYLDSQIKARHYHLTAIGKTFVYPMGLYSDKIQNLQQLQPGDVIAIPNDPSNEGRALLMLSNAGLIGLQPDAGLFATPRDIISNPQHLVFRTIDAAQLPRVLPDVTAAAITNDYIGAAGLSVHQALLHEGSDAPYANIIVVRTQDQHNPMLLSLVNIMHSKPVVQETLKLFPDGAAIPAWRVISK